LTSLLVAALIALVLLRVFLQHQGEDKFELRKCTESSRLVPAPVLKAAIASLAQKPANVVQQQQQI